MHTCSIVFSSFCVMSAHAARITPWTPGGGVGFHDASVAMFITVGLAVVSAALMCVAAALRMRERGLLPLSWFASMRRRAFAELVIVAAIVGGFVQYGATKGTRCDEGAEPHFPDGAAHEDASHPRRTVGNDELRFAVIEPCTNGVSLSIALPSAGVIGDVLDLFCTTNLLSSWSFLGEVFAGTTVPTAEVFVALLDLPGAPAAMPSAAFFVAGTHDDADGDGIYDGRERIVYGTDPLHPDTDGDGLPDGCEIASSTSPILRDTDGDGYPDDEEIASATNPLVANAGAAATIRYVYDDDDRLTAAYVGNAGGASLTEWTSTGDPATASERGRVSCGDDR